MEFEQMRLSLDEDGFEPALEDVPGPFMPAVEMLGVKAVQGLHSPAQRRARRLHQEVVVVSHQAIRVEEPGLVSDDRGEEVQKMAAIRLVAEDRSAFVSTAGDVVQRSRELQAKWSRHMHSSLLIVMWQVET
jgi:hypothetical protein